jgi:hypothetical protein
VERGPLEKERDLKIQNRQSRLQSRMTPIQAVGGLEWQEQTELASKEQPAMSSKVPYVPFIQWLQGPVLCAFGRRGSEAVRIWYHPSQPGPTKSNLGSWYGAVNNPWRNAAADE